MIRLSLLSQKSLPFLLLVFTSYLLTMTLQHWVGEGRIYNRQESAKLRLHEAILYNDLPDSHTWKSLGANGTNVRIAIVSIAEVIHKYSGASILDTYQAIDTVCLFLIFIILFIYLKNWLSSEYALLGLLFYAFMSIHSYLFFYFHPWDRPSQLLWLLILHSFHAKKHIIWILLLILAMFVKYDVLTFGLFYFAARISRQHYQKVIGNTLLICLLVVSIKLTLTNMYPTGGALMGEEMARGIPAQMAKNWKHFMHYGYYFPPLLAWSLPWLLAWKQCFSKDRHIRASVLYGYLLFVPYMSTANFREVRAELYLMFFLLPPALLTLRGILTETSVGEETK